MEARGISFPDDDGPFVDDPFIFPTPPQFQTTRLPRRTIRPSRTKAPTRLPTAHSPTAPPSTTPPPKFPFPDEGRSELDTGRIQLPLSTTALVFVGLSAFILFGVIIAGIYFCFKSRRVLKPGGSDSKSVSKAPVAPKGRGVTRPSFLPSHDHRINPNGGEMSKALRPHAVPESIHLEIPSPEEWRTNYPIKTPYSFPSTSTVVTEPEEATQAINAESQSKTTSTTVTSKPVAVEQPVKTVKPFPLQPVPVKPARSKAKECNGVNVVAPELGMGDELPTHRITVY